jgi:hypothetical protein
MHKLILGIWGSYALTLFQKSGERWQPFIQLLLKFSGSTHVSPPPSSSFSLDFLESAELASFCSIFSGGPTELSSLCDVWFSPEDLQRSLTLLRKVFSGGPAKSTSGDVAFRSTYSKTSVPSPRLFYLLRSVVEGWGDRLSLILWWLQSWGEIILGFEDVLLDAI